MNSTVTLTGLACALFGLSATPSLAQTTIYDDHLTSGWASYSWAKVDMNNTTPAHSGGKSIAVTVAAGSYGALELRTTPLDSAKYGAITFWVNGGPTGGQKSLVVKALVSGKQVGMVGVPALEANTWHEVSVPLAALGVTGTSEITGFLIQNNSVAELPTFYVDDIQFAAPEKNSPTPVGRALITIYGDKRADNWTNLSSAQTKLTSTEPVRSGQYAVSVDIAANSHGALEFGSDSFDASRYGTLAFWINGGPNGGQQGLQLQAIVGNKPQSSVSIPTPAPNVWTHIVVPLSDLGVAMATNLTGFRVSSNSNAMVPTFYVDDMQLTAPIRQASRQTSGPFHVTGHPLEYTGTNISGGEFAHPKPGIPSVYGKDFVYPSKTELDYFASKGMNVIRLPFNWAVLQPKLNEPLVPAELDRLKAAVTLATDKGLTVLIDPHSFGAYQGKFIGTPEVTNDAFADFWRQLSIEFKDNPRAWFGLMNEPHDVPAQQWADAANAAMKAIRATGAKNLILIPGVGWSGAHSWVALGNDVLLKINDPANNSAFEAHQYLDSNNSGTHPDTISATIGSERLKTFTEWCRKNHKRAFLGEFGVAEGTINHTAIDNMLNYMEANRDVWLGYTWWSAGAWWGDYMYTIEPTKDGEDRAQLAYLTPHLHGLR